MPFQGVIAQPSDNISARSNGMMKMKLHTPVPGHVNSSVYRQPIFSPYMSSAITTYQPLSFIPPMFTMPHVPTFTPFMPHLPSYLPHSYLQCFWICEGEIFQVIHVVEV